MRGLAGKFEKGILVARITLLGIDVESYYREFSYIRNKILRDELVIIPMRLLDNLLIQAFIFDINFDDYALEHSNYEVECMDVNISVLMSV